MRDAARFVPMRRGLATLGVTLLAGAGVAAAASGPTIKVAVKPDTPRSHSALSVSASGSFSQTGFPTSVKLTVQKGFRSSAKSVKVLCRSGKVGQTTSNPCPKKSKVGSGKVVGTVAVFGRQTVPFTVYLGTRQHRGDIASVVLSANVPTAGTQNVIGRLFKNSHGAIEILFSHLIKVPVSGTLNRLSLHAHAVNGRHSLITNPRSCRGGHWKATLKLGFSSGTDSKTTTVPCTK